MVSLVSLKHIACYLEKDYQISERRSCQIIGLNRSSKRNRPNLDKDKNLRGRIHYLSEKYPRFGYRKIYSILKEENWSVGKERVRLIRKQEGLQVIKKSNQKRLLGKSTDKLNKAKYPNHVWSYDFVMDQTSCGRRLKCLTVIDEYTRYGLAIYTGRSITSGDIKQILKRLFVKYGTPTCMKSDNGPEFVAKSIQSWLKSEEIKTHYIAPGSPWQNGHNESFNGVFRDGCLDRWLFYSVKEAKQVIEHWLREYNVERPHGALAGVTPARYAKECRAIKSNAA
ncbi:MAG: IS3 family transposase [Deltaproteobacteria bacterium]|nr:IS3 family transposase [Deltaproteobacteria bacterium]